MIAEISDLLAGEEEVCVQLWDQCGLLVPHNDPNNDIRLFRSAPCSRIFAARMEGRLVGSLCAGHDGHRGWLYYLAVSPESRGKGIARQLLTSAEDWLAAQGIPKLQLMIRPDNTAVATFYEKQDYHLTPRTVMAKWLDGKTAQENGYLQTEITYLEMEAPPSWNQAEERFPSGCQLVHVTSPTLAFYRFLYNTVGAPWLWWERRVMPDNELSTILQDPQVELLVLFHQGTPAGFAELDRRRPGEVELAYFGLMPEFIGQRLGFPLLKAAVGRAWRNDDQSVPTVLKVNTCNLDHPRALALYQSVGFRAHSRQTRRILDPRSQGLFSTTY